jgi:hypothetical protein
MPPKLERDREHGGEALHGIRSRSQSVLQTAIVIQDRDQLFHQSIHKILRDAIQLELTGGYAVRP